MIGTFNANFWVEVLNLFVIGIPVIYGVVKLRVILGEYPPHKHMKNGDLAVSIGEHDQISYPTGVRKA